MKKNDIIEISKTSQDLILGEGASNKIYTHAVFCQCVLPVRALKEGTRHYSVQHGSASLMFSAGSIQDPETKIVEDFEVPAGPKARLLFSYIIDQAKRTGDTTVDMGHNLYQFMQKNKIPLGGKNRAEITRQVKNIAAGNISVGMWGETETHKYNRQRKYSIAQEVSFWMPKNIDQPQLWNPELTLSDDFMGVLENHCLLLDIEPLVALQSNARAMDMYMWLSYRINTVKRDVKIPYDKLHSVFGNEVKDIRDFKKSFRKSIQAALPFIPNADVDLDTDKKHIILKNIKHSIYIPGQAAGQGVSTSVELSGVFGDLKQLGFSDSRIKKLTQDKETKVIENALAATKEAAETGSVKNPQAFVTKAIQEEWEPKNIIDVEPEKESRPLEISFGKDKAANTLWKQVAEKLIEDIGENSFKAWFSGAYIAECSENEVAIVADSRFKREHILNTFDEQLQSALNSVNKNSPQFKIYVAANTTPA